MRSYCNKFGNEHAYVKEMALYVYRHGRDLPDRTTETVNHNLLRL